MQFTQLGPYNIGKRLGRGGMGAVFEGVNANTGQPAAIKVLNPHLADDPGFRERFEIEIETLKKLKHPNIVRMFGYGEQDGHLYYAMELVRGRTVEEELQGGRKFAPLEVIRHGANLAKALKHAHDHGVIHRDIKPANLLLARGDEFKTTDHQNSNAEEIIKLTDFGIARLFGNQRLTMEGGLIGTAEYMSPEQAGGERVTPQSDLYSLGGVMYSMLAGRPPFRTASLPEMLQLQRFEPPPPLSRFASGVPGELETVILELLAKNPQSRTANALVLSRQLGAMEHGLSVIRQKPNSSATQIGVPGTMPANLESHTSLAQPAAPAPNIPPGGDPLATTQVEQTPIGEDGPPDPNLPTLDAHAVSQRPASLAKSFAAKSVVNAHATVVENRFTTLEEDEQRKLEAAREQQDTMQVGPIIALAVSLLAVVAMLWYFTKPLSADGLFSRIQLATADDSADGLTSASNDMADFLTRFPNDARAAEVKRLQDEAELQQLEQRFRSRARLLARDEQLLPVEREYLEAMNYVGLDPQEAIQRLQAIVTLYEVAEKPGERTVQCVELARRQLKKLHELAAKNTTPSLAFIDGSLARAESLRTASPDQARAIWQSIIDLYSHQPWAAARVERARAELRRLVDSDE